MDTKTDLQRAARTDGLRTRVGTRTGDDGCQPKQPRIKTKTAQDDLTKGAEGVRLFTSRLMTAQDDLARGVEATRPFQNDDSPTLTPSMSTPRSLSPTPPSDGCLANFGVVMPGVYRSAWPAPEAHDFMRSLKLKTIVTLVEKDEPDEPYAEFIEKNGIRQCVFGIQGTKKQSIPAETMRAVLQVVLDKANHPVLVHCNRGRHRTGCVVGVLRKLYGWDLPTVLSEYHSFAAPKPRESDTEYLTAVDPAALFANPQGAAPARPRSFSRLLAVVVLCLLVWFVTMYRIASLLPDRRRR